MTTWSKQTSMLQWNRTRSEKLLRFNWTGLYLNCRDYFVGGIGIMSITLFEFRLRDFFVLRTFSETIYASWSQKEEISRSISSSSTSVLDSISRCGSFGIAFVLQQFRATILTFSFIGGTYQDLCPRSTQVPLTILLSLKQCDPQLLRSGAKDLVRRWTCWFHQIFATSAYLETKIGKTFSSGFSSKHLTRSRTVRVRK